MGSTMGPSGGGREPPQYFFVPQPGSQISAKSKMNYMKKHSQEAVETSGNEAVHWEPYPQLTHDLLTWILQHPADHAILFNEMMDEEIQGKPHSQCKKDINAVITETIFCHDRQYGESYAAHPARTNIISMHQNLSLLARASALMILITGTSTMAKGFNYTCPPMDVGPVTEHGSFGDELEQEDEEERTDEGQGWGQAMSEFPANPMLVDEPPWIFDDHIASHYPANSTDTFIPSDKPISLAKCWTPSWDSCSAFWKAPYPKSPLSIISTSTSTTSSSGLQHLPKTSQTS
ncbi:hypothetical protein F5141DRAFT_1061735 [Pisolithus sp. B1]|nr:hypothetical protein F5141DRAFT_1061735 [Pisolithus sp. B1]